MNNRHDNAPVGRRLRSALSAGIALVAVLALTIPDARADRGRGGGGRGGGNMAQSSISGANRSAAHANTGNVNRGSVNTGNVNRGNVNTGNVNTGNVNRGNINTGNVNTGNVNIGNDVNINIDGGYGHGHGYGGGYHHPIAAGMVIGAVAVTTAAVLGSYYRTLPPSCSVVVKTGISYHYCGSVYYQQTWSGNDVVYVVVKP